MSNKRRVSIQYSIDESQIGHECYRLLSNTLSRLTGIVAESPSAESIMNVSTITEIKSLRNELSEIDIQLDDVNAIIDGFLNFQYENNSDIPASNQHAEKIGIPDFLNSNPESIDLGQLTDFVQQLKNTNTNNFDPDAVDNISGVLKQATPTPEASPEMIESLTEDAKNIDPAMAETSDILALLSNLNNSGGPNIEDIQKKLLNLKSRVDNNEIPD